MDLENRDTSISKGLNITDVQSRAAGLGYWGIQEDVPLLCSSFRVLMTHTKRNGTKKKKSTHLSLAVD